MEKRLLINAITDLLYKTPSTPADALKIHASLTNEIGKYLIGQLPTLEMKAEALEGLLKKNNKFTYISQPLLYSQQPLRLKYF